MERQLFGCRLAFALVSIVVVLAASGRACADPPTMRYGPPPIPRSAPNVANSPHSRELPTATASPSVDPSLQLVARSCETHIQKGFDLAKRGAIYSAQTEFFRALLLIGRSRDELSPSPQYHQAIVEALTALEEVDDFASVQASLTTDRDLAGTITSHRTVVLKRGDLSQLTMVTATRAYCAFAQQKLDFGCGRVPAASSALYGLARVEISLAREGNDSVRLGCPKAMSLYETAVRIDPNNYRAANELGVLLIRYGQPTVAIAFLEKSVRSIPTVEGWHNLSVALNSVGNDRLSHHAAMQRDALKQQRDASDSSFQSAGMKIQWVDTDTFAAKSPPDTSPGGPRSSGAPSDQVATDRVAAPQNDRQTDGSINKRSDEPVTTTASGFDRIKSGLRSIIR